jgi:hypothetical protein
MRQRAWQVEMAGGPFKEVELPRNALRAGEVLVRIAASGVMPRLNWRLFVDLRSTCSQLKVARSR